jgi:hypothetical protein
MAQKASLPGWRTIKQLRKAAQEGLLDPLQFKILIAPMVFLSTEDEDEPSSILSKKIQEVQDAVSDREIIGFKQD